MVGRGPQTRLGAVVAAGAVAVTLLLAGCGSSADGAALGANPGRPVGTGQGTVPSAASTDPSGTEPGSTIRDYVRDVNAQDVTAAEALLASQHVRALLGQPDGWLTATVSITGLSLGTPEPRDGHGTPADGYLQVVFVPARLTLARSTPGSAPTGHLTWGFLLARNSMVSRWIIVDDGPTST